MPGTRSVMSGSQGTLKTIIRMLLGAIVGAGLSLGFIYLATRLHVSAKDLRWSDFLAFWLGISFVACGLIVYVVSFNRRALARRMEGEHAKLPATEEEVKTTRLQSLTLLLAGPMLLLPILTVGPLGTARFAGSLIFTGIVLLFAIQTALNVTLWRQSDEFVRGQMLRTTAVTFSIGQAALFLWAAAERLHMARAISSWDIVTLLMTLYLATGIYMAVQNRPAPALQ